MRRCPVLFTLLGAVACVDADTRNTDGVLEVSRRQLDFGSLAPGTSKTLPITLSNAGTMDLHGLSARVPADTRHGFAVTDLPVLLAIGASVDLQVTFTAGAGASTDDATLTFTASDDVTADVSLVARTVVGEGPKCGEGTHAEAGDVCLPDVRSCDVPGGAGSQTWIDGWGVCVLASCNAGLHDEGGTCVADARACTIPDGVGTQAWVNGWGACVLASCNAGLHDEGGTCVADTRPCTIPGGVGSQSWTGSWGACVIGGCDVGFHRESDACRGDAAPAIVRQPAGVAATMGQNVTFSAEITGSPTPGLQWMINGQPIPDATGASFTAAAVTLASTGSYVLVATNAFGTATSEPAALTIPVVYASSQGAGPCWSGPSCNGGFGDPSACPAGYVDAGVVVACGNPNAPGDDPVLNLFSAINHWGCPPDYPSLGVSVRMCSPQ